jgi:hypothetical protein
LLHYPLFVLVSLGLGLLFLTVVSTQTNIRSQESRAIVSTNTNGTSVLSSSMDKTNTTAQSPPQGGEIIPGEFIVVLKEKVVNNHPTGNNSVGDLIKKIEHLGFNITSDHMDIRIISIKANNQTIAAGPRAIENAIAQIRSDPRVDSVEPNRIAVAAGIE